MFSDVQHSILDASHLQRHCRTRLEKNEPGDLKENSRLCKTAAKNDKMFKHVLYIPGPPKECFLVGFMYLKTFIKHTLGGPGICLQDHSSRSRLHWPLAFRSLPGMRNHGEAFCLLTLLDFAKHSRKLMKITLKNCNQYANNYRNYNYKYEVQYS